MDCSSDEDQPRIVYLAAGDTDVPETGVSGHQHGCTVAPQLVDVGLEQDRDSDHQPAIKAPALPDAAKKQALHASLLSARAVQPKGKQGSSRQAKTLRTQQPARSTADLVSTLKKDASKAAASGGVSTGHQDPSAAPRRRAGQGLAAITADVRTLAADVPTSDAAKPAPRGATSIHPALLDVQRNDAMAKARTAAPAAPGRTAASAKLAARPRAVVDAFRTPQKQRGHTPIKRGGNQSAQQLGLQAAAYNASGQLDAIAADAAPAHPNLADPLQTPSRPAGPAHTPQSAQTTPQLATPGVRVKPESGNTLSGILGNAKSSIKRPSGLAGTFQPLTKRKTGAGSGGAQRASLSHKHAAVAVAHTPLATVREAVDDIADDIDDAVPPDESVTPRFGAQVATPPPRSGLSLGAAAQAHDVHTPEAHGMPALVPDLSAGLYARGDATLHASRAYAADVGASTPTFPGLAQQQQAHAQLLSALPKPRESNKPSPRGGKRGSKSGGNVLSRRMEAVKVRLALAATVGVPCAYCCSPRRHNARISRVLALSLNLDAARRRYASSL